MKIKNLAITSSSTIELDEEIKSPVCAFFGEYSEFTLDLIREVIGDNDTINDLDSADDGRFVIHSEIEMDSKTYSVCYIRNADFIGDRRIAANFADSGVSFSKDDTEEYLDRLNMVNSRTCYVFEKALASIYKRIPSESDRMVAAFNSFINCISRIEDDRPVFVYDFFDMIDESVDIRPFLYKMASMGRQIFVSVGKNFPHEKMEYKFVQKIRMQNS